MTTHHCPTCGCQVRIGGKGTTKYYAPSKQTVKAGPFTAKNAWLPFWTPAERAGLKAMGECMGIFNALATGWDLMHQLAFAVEERLRAADKLLNAAKEAFVEGVPINVVLGHLKKAIAAYEGKED